MSPLALRIIAIPVLALVASIAAVLYFRAPQKQPAATVNPQSTPQSAQQASPAAPLTEQSPAAAPPQASAALPQSPAARPSAAPAGRRPPEFDIVRVAPSGETVVAGRAPGAARVELLDQGKVIAGETVDRNGEFVLLPPPLSQGDHLLALRATPEGQAPVGSNQSVAVIVRPGTSPVVTLAEPGKPSVVLAAPAPAPAAKAPPSGQPASGQKPANAAAPAGTQVTIQTAEVEAGGRFFATGTAPAGSTIRLYLNGSHVADAGTAADGKWSLTINKGVGGGKYALRADVVGEHGNVISRAEVPFDAPAAITAAAPSPAGAPPKARAPIATPPADQTATSRAPARQDAAASVAPPGASAPASLAAPSRASSPAQPAAPAQVTTSVAASPPPANPVVPEIAAVTVARGDSLWRISRLRLGKGMRYTVIYEANSSQIRDPNLIYSGQVLVVPRN